MAKVLLWCSLVVVAIGAVPSPYYRDSGDDEFIDLSSLGDKAFGLPKASTGEFLLFLNISFHIFLILNYAKSLSNNA